MLSPPPLPRTVEASLRDLASARAEMRASALGDLVRHAKSDEDLRARALPTVERLLASDPSPAVRAAAAVTLGDLGASEALPALLLAIEDDAAQVRQMAINALGEIGDVRAVPRLARALTDPRPEVRYQALIAHAKVAERADVIDALVAATDDTDDAVRYIALRIAEERLDSPEAAVDPRLLARARGLLASANVHASAHVALAAAIVLAKAGDAAGRALLLRVVEGGRGARAPEKEDEQEAIELAGRLGLREAIPHLERRVWGVARFVRDTCAWHAKVALARMGHPRATREILADLQSPRRVTQNAAIVAAGRAGVAEARAPLESLGARASDPEMRALAAEALRELG